MHKLTQTHIEKTIARLNGYGRKVDEHCARIVGKNMMTSGKSYKTATAAVSDYSATIWNMNLVN